MNYFEKLNQIDCSAHIEQKGQFNYLSWTFAVQELKKVHPGATWEVKRFHGMPYMQTDCGYFVEVEVDIDGVKMSQIHPVLDNRNKPVAQPDAFQINTSIQRCLVKAIALHGLGLYIFAGEDLPDVSQEGIELKVNSCQSVDALTALYKTLNDSDRTKYKELFSNKKEELEKN